MLSEPRRGENRARRCHGRRIARRRQRDLAGHPGRRQRDARRRSAVAATKQARKPASRAEPQPLASDMEVSSSPAPGEFWPLAPADWAEMKLTPSAAEELSLKCLMSRGTASGREIADQIAVPFGMLSTLLEPAEGQSTGRAPRLGAAGRLRLSAVRERHGSRGPLQPAVRLRRRRANHVAGLHRQRRTRNRFIGTRRRFAEICRIFQRPGARAKTFWTRSARRFAPATDSFCTARAATARRASPSACRGPSARRFGFRAA